ncbi:hypothetical protein [Burkholderia ubonensis]|uniref:hypothetical protein n=1 Tax=Burkholderia ubonensis TaxID=101571 RepID=UPI000AD0DE53|nr:hypothetical protein [Burkholderia ubonensis]
MAAAGRYVRAHSVQPESRWQKGVVEAAGACHPRVTHRAPGHSHDGLLIHSQVFRRAIFEKRTRTTKAIRSIHFNAIK